MINSDKATLIIRGEVSDVIFELNRILDYFINNNPEVIGGALVVWGDKLKTALSTGETNIELMEFMRVVTEDYIKLREDNDDE